MPLKTLAGTQTLISAHPVIPSYPILPEKALGRLFFSIGRKEV
jgi:hypothetical protein